VPRRAFDWQPQGLQTGSDPDGGYLVPTEVSKRIKKVYETSPMRSWPRRDHRRQGTRGPRDEGEVGYRGWVGEQQARPETTTSQLGLSKIVAHEMYAAPRATQNMLEDAGIDIEGWLARKVGDKFGRIENTAFLTGDGVGKPRGLLTYAGGTNDGQIEQINSGSVGRLHLRRPDHLVYALKDPYAANADFLINRLGMRDISKLKDSQGRYLWEPSKAEGRARLAARLRSARGRHAGPRRRRLIGGLRRLQEAYTIVDRLGITTLRDPFTAKPYVIFYTRTRTGGDVVNFEACARRAHHRQHCSGVFHRRHAGLRLRRVPDRDRRPRGCRRHVYGTP
jgi:predicted phage gp36 major capsid-like protein